MKVVVVGGGIAGLSTAYYLQKENHDVTLIEGDSRLGGKIVTDTPQGFVIEGGPDSFITEKPWAMQLCRELGIEKDMIGTNDERRKTYILRRGKLHEMPDGLMLVVPTRFMPFVKSRLISWPGKIRMGMDLFIKPRIDNGDESLGDFMRRRLGQEALEVLGEPMLAGIHVSDAETLSINAAFPRFRDIERKYGSLTKGMIAARKNRPPAKTSMFMTMKNGLSELAAALENAFQGNILTGNRVTDLTPVESGWQLTLEDGTKIYADAVVLATPAYVSAALLQKTSPEVADLLNSIKYVSTATISLGFVAKDLPRPLDGFGFVIPRTEPTRLLACTWTSTKFNYRAPNDHVLIRCFVGGPRRQELVSENDTTLIRIVREELASIMNIQAEPTVARVFRWQKANPQYEVGHLERVDRIESLCPPGLYVTGSAYRGVGIPDCVHQAQQTARKVTQQLEREYA